MGASRVQPTGGVVCCAAKNAECEACRHGVSEATYCAHNPSTEGCGGIPVWLLVIVIVCSVAFAAMCVKVYCGTTVARWCRRLRRSQPHSSNARRAREAAHRNTGVRLPLAPLTPQANAVQVPGRIDVDPPHAQR